MKIYFNQLNVMADFKTLSMKKKDIFSIIPIYKKYALFFYFSGKSFSTKWHAIFSY